MSSVKTLIPKAVNGIPDLGFMPVWTVGFGPKEYGQYLANKRGYSHKRTNRK